MDYDEAFDFTKKYIKHWYDYMGYRNVDYDDYAQNCAVSFYSNKKNSIDAEYCIDLAEKEYFNILIQMANDENLHSKLYVGFVDDFYPAYRIMVGKYSVCMPDYLEYVADMIVMGYTKKEMCAILRCETSAIDAYIDEIKNLYIEYNRGNLVDEKTTTI